MDASTNKQKGRYTIIAGCGRLGANLANTLSDAGESVLIIDVNKDVFRKLSPSFGGLTVVGDATEASLLSEAGIEKATAVIAVTDRDNINILIAQIAKELFNVPNVIARLYEPEKECVYREFGIETVCPATLSAKEVNKILHMSPIGEDIV